MRVLDDIAIALGMGLWWLSAYIVYTCYAVVHNKFDVINEQSTQALLKYLNNTC